MGKHHHHHLIRDSLKSFFEPHLLHLDYGETKTEIEEKVKKILSIVESGGDIDHDEEDESKRVMVAELVKEFYRGYESLYRQYDDLTGEIRKQIHDNQNSSSSSSSSSSDSDSDTKRYALRVKKQTKSVNPDIADLKRKNLELESELEKEKVTIKKLKDDCEKAQETLQETIESLRNQVEMKGEEIEGLMEKMSNIEVKLRLSNQKLRITEQALTEKEEESKRIETKYLEKQALLQEKIRGLIEKNSERILNRFQSLSEKLGSYEETVVEATKMLKFVIEMKKEKEVMEKKLERKVREEEQEKEKLKERLLDLGEEKREAIRQLCIWIDHHRDRCEYLEDLLSKIVLARRQR